MIEKAKQIISNMEIREREALADNIIDTLFFVDDEERLVVAELLTEVNEDLGETIKKCMIF